MLGLFIILIVFLLGYSVNLYQTVRENKEEGFSDSIARVEAELVVDEIHGIHRYHGEDPYHVIEVTKDDTRHMVFINLSDDEMLVLDTSEWVEESVILATFESTRPVQTIRGVSIGIRRTTPLIEIVYRDQNNRLSYDYFRLDDGSYDSGISFRENF